MPVCVCVCVCVVVNKSKDSKTDNRTSVSTLGGYSMLSIEDSKCVESKSAEGLALEKKTRL